MRSTQPPVRCVPGALSPGEIFTVTCRSSVILSFCYIIQFCTEESFHICVGRAVAQMVSRRLPAAAIPVRSQFRSS
jgi:hypothetical protein